MCPVGSASCEVYSKMVPQIKPVKKESYFNYVDSIITAPNQDKLILSTYLCKKYLLDVKLGILSSGSAPCQLAGISKQRIFNHSLNKDVYALATNTGVSICKWDKIVETPGKCQSETSFYSVDWIGENVIAGKAKYFI